MVLRRVVSRFCKNYDSSRITCFTRHDDRIKLSVRFYRSSARLTPQEVSKILRNNEFTKEFESSSSIKFYESNQLASNNPIEDTRSEAKCLLTNVYRCKGIVYVSQFLCSFLMGIFDGHGGSACAQVVAKRLFHYISACLLPPKILTKYMDSHGIDENFRLLERYNDKLEFVSGIKSLYNDSYVAFLHDIVNGKISSDKVEDSLISAFLRLDNDLSDEALHKLRSKDAARTLSVAMSGAVAVVAHIDGAHLHVAGVGDCQAVLGSHSENEGWSSKSLTVEHNADNLVEVERILSEHPPMERSTVIKMERLLGQLAPLRSLGDFRYKWSKELMNEVVIPYLGEAAVPPNYYTPPYLTARPDVTYHKLRANDKFLILASDGLWDLLTPSEAVHLVAEHMSGKMSMSPLKLPQSTMKLSEINEMLLQRKEGLRTKPLDGNAATHLLRHALGGTDHGIEHNKLSQFLTLPSDVVRVFRDDITITIIYFNSDFFLNSTQ